MKKVQTSKTTKKDDVPIVNARLSTKKQSSVPPAAIRIPKSDTSQDKAKMIMEENQRTLTRAQTTEKDHSNQEFTFDLDGRLIPLLQTNWSQPQTVKVRIPVPEKPKLEEPTPTLRNKKLRKKVTNYVPASSIPIDGFIEDPSLSVPSIVSI
jgi:hypothetical protein